MTKRKESLRLNPESIKKVIKKEAPTKETWSNFIKEIMLIMVKAFCPINRIIDKFLAELKSG